MGVPRVDGATAKLRALQVQEEDWEWPSGISHFQGCQRDGRPSSEKPAHSRYEPGKPSWNV